MVAHPDSPRWSRGAAAGSLLIVGSLAATVLGSEVARLVPDGHERIPRALVAVATIGAATALAIWLCGQLAFRGRTRDWAAVGITRPRRALGSVLRFIPLAVAVVTVTGIITSLLGLTGTTAVESGHRSQGFKLLIAFLTVVLAPWTEELAIRGFLYTGLEGRIGQWPAAGLSALIWSALHLVWGVLVIFAGVGVLLAWLRERTGSILPGVALHGSWNAFAAASTGASWWVAGAWAILVSSLVIVARRADPA